jgi:DNA-binding LacI/PurR family transcriptional regulator
VAEAERRRGRGVTTEDVARAAAVSRVTVSRVLNNHHNVTASVRQRVLQAAADLGYLSQRSKVGRAAGDDPISRPVPVLREIGFFFTSILPDEPVIGNPFWSPLLHGVEQEATAAGIRVTYRSIGEADSLVEPVRSGRLDGVLLVGPASEATVRALHGAGRPLVLVDNVVPGVPVDAVLGDSFGGGRAAVAHLVEVGHRDIAFIGGPFRVSPPPLRHMTNTIWSVEQRALGYWTALSEAGIRPDDALYEGDNLTTAGGYAACRRLLASGRRLTAIFCANDQTAIGAMRALHEAGLAVPRDVSVIGFDDIAIAQHLIPPLTTVRMDTEAIGAWAVRRLVARALAPAAITSTTALHVELVPRGTVALPH